MIGTLRSAPQNRGAPAVARLYIKKHLKRFAEMVWGARIMFFAQKQKKAPKGQHGLQTL